MTLLDDQIPLLLQRTPLPFPPGHVRAAPDPVKPRYRYRPIRVCDSSITTTKIETINLENAPEPVEEEPQVDWGEEVSVETQLLGAQWPPKLLAFWFP